MKNDPDKINETIPEHVKFWNDLPLSQFMGGPFKDNSGGLILFQANKLEDALNLIEQDPFVKNDCIADKMVKEWSVA
jgi:uncharacterized protein YciI